MKKLQKNEKKCNGLFNKNLLIIINLKKFKYRNSLLHNGIVKKWNKGGKWKDEKRWKKDENDDDLLW